jgi:hypothetical protein
MATSLKNPPATEASENGTKKYLDFAGLNALWDNICDKFAPQWKSVNFDFIANNQPEVRVKEGTGEEVIDLKFQNLSMAPTADGVVDHTHVNQVNWELKCARKDADSGEYVPGIMSSVDKAKLDALDSTLGSNIDTAVKINEIKIGDAKDTATSLVVEITENADSTKNKAVAFGLDYDATKDELSIVDLNNNKAKVSTVKILEDAFKDAMFQNADVIVENGVTYLYFELLITPQQGSAYTKELKVNVNDLVSVYEAGDGIDLTIGNDSTTDDNATSTKITLVAPKVVSNDNKIGGIKPNNIYSEANVTGWTDKETKGAAPKVQELSNASARYFGVETDKDGHAFVNVPVATINIGTDSAADAQTISNNNSDAKFTVVSGLTKSLSDDGQTWTIVPELKEITLSREEEITVTPTAPTAATTTTIVANGAETIDGKDNFITVIDGFEVEENTHKLSYTQKKIIFNETPVNVTDEAGDDITIDLIPGVTTAKNITVVTDLDPSDPNGHNLVKTTQKVSFTVADPSAIDIDYIEGLVWKVPITKKHFPNETTTE